MSGREKLQLALGLVAVLLALVLSQLQVGPFQALAPEQLNDKDPSLWLFLLSDHVTLGFVRLGLIALAAYAIASIPALIVGGRWIKSFGASGLSADDATETKTTIAKLTHSLNTVKGERDRARVALQKARERLSE